MMRGSRGILLSLQVFCVSPRKQAGRALWKGDVSRDMSTNLMWTWARGSLFRKATAQFFFAGKVTERPKGSGEQKAAELRREQSIDWDFAAGVYASTEAQHTNTYTPTRVLFPFALENPCGSSPGVRCCGGVLRLHAMSDDGQGKLDV